MQDIRLAVSASKLIEQFGPQQIVRNNLQRFQFILFSQLGSFQFVEKFSGNFFGFNRIKIIFDHYLKHFQKVITARTFFFFNVTGSI